jgi:plasmid stability protein
MAQLLVRNIPDEVVRSLKLRAAAHGVSTEEEHRRILAKAVAETGWGTSEAMKSALKALAESGAADDENDWLFDRNDPRNSRMERRDQGLFDD